MSTMSIHYSGKCKTMVGWFEELRPKDSRLHDVNEALSAWKHACWSGKPADYIAHKKAALDYAKLKYIQNRGK